MPAVRKNGPDRPTWMVGGYPLALKVTKRAREMASQLSRRHKNLHSVLGAQGKTAGYGSALRRQKQPDLESLVTTLPHLPDKTQANVTLSQKIKTKWTAARVVF